MGRPVARVVLCRGAPGVARKVPVCAPPMVPVVVRCAVVEGGPLGHAQSTSRSIHCAYESCILVHAARQGARTVSVGTPFHPRTSALNRKQQWREWSGYYAASVYADLHDIEYNAIRDAAALIDVSAALQVRACAGRDAVRARRSRHHPRRDQAQGRPGRLHGLVRRARQGHRRRHRRTASTTTEFRWTAADPQLRWLRLNARGLDVEIDDVTESPPRSRSRARSRAPSSRPPTASVRRPALLPPPRRQDRPRSRSTSRRTGYTGDLGYELWVGADKALARLGRADRRPAGRSRHPAGGHARARRRRVWRRG